MARFVVLYSLHSSHHLSDTGLKAKFSIILKLSSMHWTISTELDNLPHLNQIGIYENSHKTF